MDMAIDFESKFFEALQDSVADVKGDIKDLSKKVDQNTKVTNSISIRVDKLDGKVFRKNTGIPGLFSDRTLITALAIAIMVFLLILASVLHVKIPTL